jgi:hypothetical protein
MSLLHLTRRIQVISGEDNGFHLVRMLGKGKTPGKILCNVGEKKIMQVLYSNITSHTVSRRQYTLMLQALLS